MDIEILTNFTQILIDSLRKVQTDDIPEDFVSVLDELIRIANYISNEIKSRRQCFDTSENTVCVPDENKEVTLLDDVTEDETYPSNTSNAAASEICDKTDCTKATVAVLKMGEEFRTKRQRFDTSDNTECVPVENNEVALLHVDAVTEDDTYPSNTLNAAASEICDKTDCTKATVAVVKMREEFRTRRCMVALNRVNIHRVLNIHGLQHTSRLVDVRKTVMSTNDDQGNASVQVVEKADRYIRVNHEGKRFKCNHKKCDRMLRSRSGLRYHTLMHECKNPEICEVCNRAFRHPTNLLRHMKMHSGERPYQCEVCDLRFSRFDILKVHLRIHSGEKPFVCKVCHKAFRQSVTLSHHNKLHTGDKPWKCAHCRMSYSRKFCLRSHLLKCFPKHQFQDRFEDKPQESCKIKKY